MRLKIFLRGISVCAGLVAGMVLSGCGSGVLPGNSFLGSIPPATGASPTNPTGGGTGTTGGGPSTGPVTGTNPSGGGTTAPPTSSPSSGGTAAGPSAPTTGSPAQPSAPSVPPAPAAPAAPPAPAAPVVEVMGKVYSGQHPVSGAKISFFAAGNSGYGEGATSLLSNAKSISTENDGSFLLADAYKCPADDAQVYMVAAGGDTGAGANSGTVLMSALGDCGKVGSSPIVLNEMTTVASVYALDQFMSPGSTAVGASRSNLVGLKNAFRMVANLYDSTSGRVRETTPAGNGTVPGSKINALANVLAACIESPSGSPACLKLFQATVAGGITPRDTLAAALNIALNPRLNLGSLTLSGPYQPSLAGAPNDWTLSVEYTGGGLNYGQLIAADGEGNIWVPNAVDPGTLSKFSPAGEPLSGAKGFAGGGLSYPLAVAIDQTGDAWAANVGNNSVSKHNADGTPLSGSGFVASELKLPYALALDSGGNVLTANGDNTVAKLSSSGALVAQFQQGGLDFPYAVAVDRSQNLWVANYGYSNSVSKFSDSGGAAAPKGYSGGGITGAVGVAIDAGGNAWIASFDHPVVSKLSAGGTPLSGVGYTIPAGAASIAVDGDNTVWTANSDGSVSRFSNTGAAISPATGFISDGATAGVGIAIDPSGNVWTSDNYVNSIFEYVGAAAPTVVPLQVAVKSNLLGKRP